MTFLAITNGSGDALKLSVEPDGYFITIIDEDDDEMSMMLSIRDLCLLRSALNDEISAYNEDNEDDYEPA